MADPTDTNDAGSAGAEDAGSTGGNAPEPGSPEALDAEFEAAWAEADEADGGGDGADPPGGGAGTDAGSTQDTSASDDADTTQDPPADRSGDADQAPAPSDAGGDDVWANAPEELRTAFEAERQRADAAEQGRRTAEGRHTALQRRVDTLMAGGDAGGRRPNGDQPPANRSTHVDNPPPEDAEARREFEAAVADYPEIAGPIQKILASQDARIAALVDQNQRVTAALETVGQDRLAASEATQIELVAAEHPDHAEIANSADFIAWHDEQPAYVQRAIMENAEAYRDARTINRLLSDYKRDRGMGTAKPNGSGAGGNPPGERTPADPAAQLRLRSNTGGLRPSPGATAPDGGGRGRPLSYDEEWERAEAEEQRQMRREAHIA